jgi:putative DeoR family transcriptional regulator (stage III sporulation protein D)
LNDVIWTRAVNIGEHIFRTKATVRDTALTFKVSKSTVHKDVTERLPRIQPGLAQAVKTVLEHNKAQRHLRGGEATRKKYQEPDVVTGG